MPANIPQNKTPNEGGSAPKKQTARISLENALSLNAADPKRSTSPMAGGPIPQTIRLKKPPTAPLFVKPPTAPVPPLARRDPDHDVKSMTTVLRELPENDATSAKRETSRIILRDTAQVTAMESQPDPRTDPKHATAPITGIPISAAGIPQTIRLKRPPTSSLAVKPPDLSTTATTRARPAAPAAQPLKPTAGVPLSEAPTVTRAPAGAGRLKAETSRIVLDSASMARPPAADPKRATSPMAGATATAPIAGAASAQPQTIRLKRPADSLAIKPDMATDTAEVAKSQTAKIDLPSGLPDAGATSSITQRKTIKIKRTERNVTPSRTLVLKRSTAGAAEPAPDAAAEPAVTETEPAADTAENAAAAAPTVHWAFATIAALALICAIGLAYLTAAQAFGPDLQLPVPAQLL